ncbi:MAG: nucleotidyltransferase domain-containing protein [Nitrospinae bacterium]|nr:nucleotidyltransferase domain-containing protein [Nitrospinota bacterium]
MDKETEYLDGVVQAIVHATQPEKIILFGSRARGEHGAGSDYDILVIEREPFGPARSRRKELSKIRRAIWDAPLPIDLLVYSLDEYEEMQSSLNHVLQKAAREGKSLYERH